MTETNVIFPVDYCENGNQIGTISGRDGISVHTYSLGDTPGFVEIKFDTYIIPDRIDIRYNREWVRSTGKLLDKNTPSPPIKECDQVTSEEGFVGESGTFHMFYDPNISKKLDIYVSGCLGGGTVWEYSITDCPREKPVLGVHSNSDPTENIISGHAWISLTQSGR